jgi:glycosyltransferase involved in cell wall biosynthesis
MKRVVTFLVPHLRPSGGIRHILELAAGLLRRGWDVRVRVAGVYGHSKKFKQDAPEEQLKALDAWWENRSSGLLFEFGTLRTLRPYGEPAARFDYGGAITVDVDDGNGGRRPVTTVISHHQRPDWKGEIIVTYGDAENEMFQSTYLRDALAVLLVLDWLAFDPTRQLRYIQQGTWDGVVCSSTFLQEKLAGAGVEAVRIAPGVEMLEFHRIPTEPGPVPTLGTLYGPGSKGWRDACMAAAAVASARGAPVRLLAYGAEPAEMLEGIRGVEIIYKQRPTAEQKRHIYSACDVWLCTSYTEGYGFPSLEAMACGTPVVTYENGGHSDFQIDGVTGRFVPVGDSAGMARVVGDLLGRPALLDRMGRECVNIARQMTWPRACDQFSDYLGAIRSARGLG